MSRILFPFQYFITNLCELESNMNKTCKLAYHNSNSRTISSLHNSIRSKQTCTCSQQGSAYKDLTPTTVSKENTNPAW